ncbi:hypothetical protein ACRAWD_21645 [Caulobacter segnis]
MVGPNTLTCRRSRAASYPGPRSRSPTATSPTRPWCWPARAAGRASSWST